MMVGAEEAAVAASAEAVEARTVVKAVAEQVEVAKASRWQSDLQGPALGQRTSKEEQNRRGAARIQFSPNRHPISIRR